MCQSPVSGSPGELSSKVPLERASLKAAQSPRLSHCHLNVWLKWRLHKDHHSEGAGMGT